MSRLHIIQFIKHAETVLHRVEEYEKSGGHDIPSQDLMTSKRGIQYMIDRVRNQTLPPKEKRYRTLTRLINDQWPWGHVLGKQISDLEEEYIHL